MYVRKGKIGKTPLQIEWQVTIEWQEKEGLLFWKRAVTLRIGTEKRCRTGLH